MSDLRISIIQADFIVGDISGNITKIVQKSLWAKEQEQANIVVFPELSLLGYPPEDLLLRPRLHDRIQQALSQLSAITDIYIVVGYPALREGKLYNALGVFLNGQCVLEYHKQKLPNYQVFDEKRYFHAGNRIGLLNIQGQHIAFTICEDLWHSEPALASQAAGADLLISINASPFNGGKQAQRKAVLQARSQETQLPILYVNCVGGQDELIFDGGSMAINANQTLAAELPRFVAQDQTLIFREKAFVIQTPTPELNPMAELYQALVLAVRDYVQKNGFKGVVLGLSGGIDSALTLAIAVDAIGADKVHAVMMPYRYTSDMSLEDAQKEAQTLGIHYSVLSIEPIVQSFLTTLADEFAGLARDTTEENLQARARGVLLMALSNKKGLLVLTTGNKSEMAVGYATLYGDMAGGFDVLKDIPKTTVFELSRYCNTLHSEHPPIPERVITRPPSAELAPDQKDEDSLPPYPILDAILKGYIEHDLGADDLVAQGFERETVTRVIRMVDFNEYKRRQAAIGPRVSQRGFGRDRRYPIVNKWKADQ